MSGHSKWSKVKHQKAVTDVVKAAAFTKASRAITIAVKEGAGVTDPDKNFRLRLAIDQARAVNMPKDTIDRAVTRAAGAGESLEYLMYEAYAPGSVALLIGAATDNRQRAISAVKNLVEKRGGTIAQPGSVSFLFKKFGVVTVPKSAGELGAMEELAIASGADDLVESADMYEFYTDPSRLHEVREALEHAGLPIDHAQIIMKANAPIDAQAEIRTRTEELTTALEALEDVQHVYTNIL